MTSSAVADAGGGGLVDDGTALCCICSHLGHAGRVGVSPIRIGAYAACNADGPCKVVGFNPQSLFLSHGSAPAGSIVQ